HYILQIGRSEFLVRLPYAILSIADVGVLYLVARDVAGRRVALRAALLLAILPLHVWYGQEARWYAQWSLLATLSFWALLRAWRTGRWRWWAGYAVTATMALYTYVVSLQLLAAQAVTAWLLPRREPGSDVRRRFVAAALVVLALSWPMIHIALNLRVDSPEPGGGMVGTPRATALVVVPYTFFSYVAGYSVGPTVTELHAFPDPASILREFPEIILYYVIFGAFAVLGLWALRRGGPTAAIVLPWSVGLPLIVLLSAIVAGQTYNVRYGFAALPGFAILLALGIESLGRWRAAGTLAAAALFAFSLGNYYWNPRYDKEHVRDAASYVRSSPYRDAPLALIGQVSTVAAHYGPDLGLRRLYGCRPSEPDQTGGMMPAVRIDDLRAQRRWWLLVSRDWGGYAGVCLERSE
ncbi:MAG: glycosyltransferase family 39 protein, partial [Candidatus Rokuibacteriota bacterium]